MRNPEKICYNCLHILSREGCVCPKCGWDNAVRESGAGYLRACVLNNQYFVGRALGRGGFGVTYLGFDLNLDRRVAIKEYFPAALALRTSDSVTIAPYSGSQEKYSWGLQRAMDEGATTARLSAVPNTVQVYSAFQANGTAYLVMEYIEGTTLTKLVAANGPMPWPAVMGLMRPIMDALEAIHQQGVIHRDVSPDNIMLRARSAKTVLLDFGAARPYEDTNRGMTEVVRPGFGPPEQYRSNARQDGRTDEYALCATMYYLLTGKIPPPSDMLACDAEPLKTPRELGADIPAEAEDALLKGMSARMGDRYPDIHTLREVFEAAKEDPQRLDTIVSDGPVPEQKPESEPKPESEFESEPEQESEPELESEPEQESEPELEPEPVDIGFRHRVVIAVDSEGNAEMESQPESKSQSDSEAWIYQRKNREEEAQEGQDPPQEEEQNPIHWPDEPEPEPEPETDNWKTIAKWRVFVIAIVFILLFVGTRIIDTISKPEYERNRTVVAADDYETPVTKRPTSTRKTTPTPKPAPAKTPEPYYPTLQRKDSGDEVRDLQMELIERNYLYDIADGSYGEKTENAVKQVQEDAGLPVTGIADSATQNALRNLERDFEPQADNQLMIVGAETNGNVMRIIFKNMGRNTVTGYSYNGYQCNASKKVIGNFHGDKGESIISYWFNDNIELKPGEVKYTWSTMYDGYESITSKGEAYTMRFFDGCKYARFVLTEFTTEDGKTHKVSGKSVYAELQ